MSDDLGADFPEAPRAHLNSLEVERVRTELPLVGVGALHVLSSLSELFCSGLENVVGELLESMAHQVPGDGNVVEALTDGLHRQGLRDGKVLEDAADAASLHDNSFAEGLSFLHLYMIDESGCKLSFYL